MEKMASQVYYPLAESPPSKTEDIWKQTSNNYDTEGKDELAVAIGITHSIAENVLPFLDRNSLPVRRMEYFEVVPEPGASAMRDIGHCIQLAKSVVREIKSICDNGKYKLIHLFLASPSSFAFQLGREFNALGYQWQLYEFTFDKDESERTYIPSLSKRMFPGR